jgi:hypothetical protein
MSTEKSKKAGVATKFNTAIIKTKETVKGANNFALNTTEELVTGTINATSQWQKVTSTALRGGFELMSNQQNLVFDALESFKKQAIEGKKRVATLFA